MERFADEASRSFRRFFTEAPNLAQSSFAGIAGGIALARKALTDYAKDNSYFAAQSESFQSAWSSVWREIGRQTSGAVPQLMGVLAVVNDIRNALVDFGAAGLGVLFGNNLNAIRAADEANRVVEGLDKEIARRKEINRLQNEARADALELAGDKSGAMAIREQIRLAEELRKISGLASGTDKEALTRQLRENSAARIAAASRGRTVAGIRTLAFGGNQDAAFGRTTGFSTPFLLNVAANVERQQLEAQRRTNDLLQKVVDKINTPTTARSALGTFG
jgi:hypothetical protein